MVESLPANPSGARRSTVRAALAGLAFVAAFLGASAVTFAVLARAKPVARALAGRGWLAAVADAWVAPPQYTATAKVRHVVEGPVIAEATILPELGQMVKVMESEDLARVVAKSLGKAPPPGAGPNAAAGLLEPREISARLLVEPDRESRTLAVAFSHPEPGLAAAGANLFAEEFLAHTEWLYTDPQMRQAHDLNARLGEARQQIIVAEDLARAAGSGAPAAQYQQALEQAEIRYGELLGEISTLGNIVYDEPQLVIVERATPPAHPTPSPVWRALSISLAAGLAAGLAAALLVAVALRQRRPRGTAGS